MNKQYQKGLDEALNSILTRLKFNTEKDADGVFIDEMTLRVSAGITMAWTSRETMIQYILGKVREKNPKTCEMFEDLIYKQKIHSMDERIRLKDWSEDLTQSMIEVMYKQGTEEYNKAKITAVLDGFSYEMLKNFISSINSDDLKNNREKRLEIERILNNLLVDNNVTKNIKGNMKEVIQLLATQFKFLNIGESTREALSNDDHEALKKILDQLEEVEEELDANPAVKEETKEIREELKKLIKRQTHSDLSVSDNLKDHCYKLVRNDIGLVHCAYALNDHHINLNNFNPLDYSFEKLGNVQGKNTPVPVMVIAMAMHSLWAGNVLNAEYPLDHLIQSRDAMLEAVKEKKVNRKAVKCDIVSNKTQESNTFNLDDLEFMIEQRSDILAFNELLKTQLIYS